MYRILEGSTHGLPDVARFLETLNEGRPGESTIDGNLFDANQDLIVTRAPGRLDVMGGIADYSGSLVLQMPIREGTCVALQRDPCRVLRVVSRGAKENERCPIFEMRLDTFGGGGLAMSYPEARAFFSRDRATRWAGYVAGAFLVLMRERKVAFDDGARILVSSEVPEGKGVSSSAALEVSTMAAIAVAFEIDLQPIEIAALCQKVENLVVGAPCGIMDQMTAVHGEEDRLMALLCQPAVLQGMVDIPDDLCVWGLDSGVRHSVSGSDYTSVRVGAFMGYRMIAAHAGLGCERLDEAGKVKVHDPIWGGYLANLTPSVFEDQYRAMLPDRISGEEFLSRFGGSTDSVTSIRPEVNYAVRVPTAHPVYEHFRVRTFAALLAAGACGESEHGSRSTVASDALPVAGQGEEGSRKAAGTFPGPHGTPPDGSLRSEILGELMYQSHASYSACGLGCDETDRIVGRVRDAGPSRGLFGAKITGGGSGGTVAILGRPGADATVEEIADTLEKENGSRPRLFSGSSIGAASFGHLRLRRG